MSRDAARRAGMIAFAVVASMLVSPPVSADDSPAPGTGPVRRGGTEKLGPSTTEAPPVTSLLVRYRQGVSPQRTDGTIVGQARTGVELTGVSATGANGWQRVGLGQSLSVQAADSVARALTADSRVIDAEPNLRFRPTVADYIPDDPLFPAQWDLLAPLTPDAAPLSDPASFGIQTPQAWNVTQGGASPPVVAVIDTGYTTHPDLGSVTSPMVTNGRWVPGYDFVSQDLWLGTPHPYTANDGDGRDPNPADPGDWISIDEDAGTEDDGFFVDCGVESSSWHGTHVAGTVGATLNNAVGVAGMLATARIQPVRVLGKCGGYTDDIAAGITWASGGTVAGVPDNPTPAKVLNLSLGYSAYSPTTCPTVLQNAVTGARNRGSVVVVAAGNDDLPADSPLANCTGVVTVAATSQIGDRAAYSNYGSNVDLAAPGGDFWVDDGIMSTINDGETVPGGPTYAQYQGTSMATPHVAGAAALYLTQNPSKTPSEVETALTSSTYPFPYSVGYTFSCRGSDGSCGSGILNVAKLLGAPSSPERPSTVRNVTVTAADSAVDVRFDPPSTANATSYFVSAVDLATDQETSVTVSGTSVRVPGLTNGRTYDVYVRAGNANGFGVQWWAGVSVRPVAPPSPPPTPSSSPVPGPLVTPTPTVTPSNQSVKAPAKRMKRGTKKKLSKASSAGLRITWKAAPRKVCTVKKGRLVGLRKGTCRVTATVGGDTLWLPLRKTFRVKIR